MKIIHCADLHLDSKMNTNLDKAKSKERKSEILHTFERMVDYASRNRIPAILIAGDMFDTKNISSTTRNAVIYSIETNPDITFFYLKGNHDNDNFLSGMEEIPDNLKLFGTSWTKYSQSNGKINILGIELTSDNIGQAYLSLVLDSDNFNIVMLHGQESEGTAGDKAQIINLKALRGKGIDYLALGHIHSYKEQRLDSRGIYCYPGCLEGRGFDECGEHGFVVLDIDEDTGHFTHNFIPFAKRRLYEINVDVTGCLTTSQMISRVETQLEISDCDSDSLVKIVLKGTIDVECEKDLGFISAKFGDRFYHVKVSDETTLKIDIGDYMLDESLKGEFVRQVMSDSSITDEDKKIIVRYGLQALDGEELK